MISQLTIQHVALNYELADYASYIPNTPTKLYNDTRVSGDEFSVYNLPNMHTSVVSLLSGNFSYQVDQNFFQENVDLFFGLGSFSYRAKLADLALMFESTKNLVNSRVDWFVMFKISDPGYLYQYAGNSPF